MPEEKRHPWFVIWLPFAVTIAALFIPQFLSRSWEQNIIVIGLPYVFFVGLAYFFVLTVLRVPNAAVFKDQARDCLLWSLVAILPALLVPAFSQQRHGGEDTFADHLVIPEGIELNEPLPWPPEDPKVTDQFQQTVLSSLKRNDNRKTQWKLELSNLVAVQNQTPELLERYLASHPAWRVCRRNGTKVALRRWARKGHWNIPDDGIYSNFSDQGPNYYTRLALGLDEKPQAPITPHTTTGVQGDVIEPIIKNGNLKASSHCVFNVGQMVVEVAEQSDFVPRHITRASVDLLNRELEILKDVRTWSELEQALSTPVSSRQAASIALYRSPESGNYVCNLLQNSGEPGVIYLKAFEVTQRTQLSKSKLRENSNERIGWSNDPAEQFFSNCTFFIEEGGPGKPYAARFEVWFIPDSGQPERKIDEKIFKIEGHNPPTWG